MSVDWKKSQFLENLKVGDETPRSCHILSVFLSVNGLYVVMRLASLMDGFLSERSHESIKAVIQVGSFTVQIPRMDEMPPKHPSP